MTDFRRTTVAPYAEAVSIVADRLWLRREAEREMTLRFGRGDDVMAQQFREYADRRLTEASAVAEAVAILYAADYDSVMDDAYDRMHELYDARDERDGERG